LRSTESIVEHTNPRRVTHTDCPHPSTLDFLWPVAVVMLSPVAATLLWWLQAWWIAAAVGTFTVKATPLWNTAIGRLANYHAARDGRHVLAADSGLLSAATFSSFATFAGAYVFGSVFTAVMALWFHFWAAGAGGSSGGLFRNPSLTLFLCLMEIQTLRRLGECLWVHDFSGRRRASFFATVFAWIFYPFLVATVALDLDERGSMGVSPQLGLGLVIFALGSWAQHQCHRALAALRSRDDHRAGATGRTSRGSYVLPNGPWFQFVSCPHYTAELVLYVGLFLAVGDSVSARLVFSFMAVFLGSSAFHTHAWYRQKFRSSFPVGRKALIPFVF
jgi:3-oxo-5-alpha-steroid 4-dehydrogenase